MSVETGSRGSAALLLAFVVGALLGATGTDATAADGVFAVGGDGTIISAGPVDNLCVASLPSAQIPPPDFGFISYTLTAPLAFSGLTELSADYDMQTGCFGGGSPRFQVRVDYDNDGLISAGDRNVFIYWGTPPNFTDCPSGWGNTGNLIASSDLRYDLTSVGGAFYSTHTDAVNLIGTLTVLRVSVIVDGGFTGGQVALVDAFKVNNDTFDSCCDCEDGLTCNGAETCNPTTELCEAGTPPDCSDGDPCTYDSCDEQSGCASTVEPDPTCRDASGGFAVRDSAKDARDGVKWKWFKGAATLFEEFGDPITETQYDLCIYDYHGGTPSVAGHLALAPSALWEPRASSQYRYRDRTGASDGITRAKLKSGSKPKIGLSAKGLNLPTPTPIDSSQFFDVDPYLTVQLSNGTGVCWVTQFDRSYRNTATRYKTKKYIIVH
jgi:hypothetical protein